MSSRKTGFKQCKSCARMMSITDPHDDCLWCLGSSHDVEGCRSCFKMNPKALREREAKLLLAKVKGKEAGKKASSSARRSTSRQRSRSKSRGRSASRPDSRARSRSRSASRSASEHASGSSRKKHKRRKHSSRHHSGKESSGSKKRRHHRDFVSPSPLDEPVRVTSPVRSREGTPDPELPNPDSFHSPEHEEVPRTPSPVVVPEGPEGQEVPMPGQPPLERPMGAYPPFPGPGQDPSNFLNAMFGVYARAWNPTGAPAGPVGPLSFNLGVPQSYTPAPFMPFMPAPYNPWLGVAPPRSATPVSASPAPPASNRLRGLDRGSTPVPVSLPPAPRSTSAPAPSESLPDPLTSVRREWSRRRAQRLLEEKEYGDPEVEEGELLDQEDYFEDLQCASGLELSPEWGLPSVSDAPSKDVAPYHIVIKKAAELLDLTLPSVEFKPNILTEVLHSPSSIVEPTLPFTEALTEPILEVWKRPLTAPAVSRSIARRYRVAPGDPEFLSTHPSPESLVVQAACSNRSAGSFPQVPADKDSKKLDQSAKKIFSSGSMALKSTNATCLLGRYVHALMDSVKQLSAKLPEEDRKSFNEVVSDTQAAARQVIQSGMDTADSVARIMGSTVATRRAAWLKSSEFSADVQSTLLDLPFDGAGLFGKKADVALERFKDSRATARSLGLQTRGSTTRKFRGFGRSSFRQYRQSQPQQQQQQNPLYKSYRGKQRGRGRGRQLSSSSTSSSNNHPPPAAGKQP